MTYSISAFTSRLSVYWEETVCGLGLAPGPILFYFSPYFLLVHYSHAEWWDLSLHIHIRTPYLYFYALYFQTLDTNLFFTNGTLTGRETREATVSVEDIIQVQKLPAFS